VATRHERNGALRSQIRFASYETDTFDPNRQWTVNTIGISGGHDALPALDIDTVTGRVLVAWYAFWYNQSRYPNVGRMIEFLNNAHSSRCAWATSRRSATCGTAPPATFTVASQFP